MSRKFAYILCSFWFFVSISWANQKTINLENVLITSYHETSIAGILWTAMERSYGERRDYVETIGEGRRVFRWKDGAGDFIRCESRFDSAKGIVLYSCELSRKVFPETHNSALSRSVFQELEQLVEEIPGVVLQDITGGKELSIMDNGKHFLCMKKRVPRRILRSYSYKCELRLQFLPPLQKS